MNRALLGLLSLSLSACNLRPLEGNDPDGGTCPALTAPAGSGASDRFEVGASYQHSSQWVSDAGVTGALLTVSLYEGAVGCRGSADAGSFAAFAIDFPGVDRARTGTFPREGGDAGATFFGWARLDGGSWEATAGTVTIATLENCALTGSFAMELSRGGDAGVTLPFSGTFSSAYCR